MGALSSEHFIYELSDKLNSDIFKNFLLRLIDQLKKVVIVIDHGPYHVSKIMQEFYEEHRAWKSAFLVTMFRMTRFSDAIDLFFITTKSDFQYMF